MELEFKNLFKPEKQGPINIKDDFEKNSDKYQWKNTSNAGIQLNHPLTDFIGKQKWNNIPPTIVNVF
jgi:hypothetical protein